MDRLIYEEFLKLPDQLHVILKKKYVETLIRFNQNMDRVLKRGFNMPSSYKFLRAIETSLNAHCCEKLTLLFNTQAR